MRIAIFKNIDEIYKLKDNWNRVYLSDSLATPFVSWAWLCAWIDMTPNWLVLAIQSDRASPYIAFMPLSIHFTEKRGYKSGLNLTLGHFTTDEASFLCLPEYNEEAMKILAKFIQSKMKWDTFYLQNILDSRLDGFLKMFSGRKFYVLENNSKVCPYINLPNNWEKYLKDFLGPKTRENIKKYTRKIENIPNYRITKTNEENLDNQIETLLMLHQNRWGTQSEDKLRHYRSIFRSHYQNHSLWLNILWEGKTPIVALAAFVEEVKKILFFYTIGFDDRYAKLSPGKVIIGYSIRYAIENGFEIYDFGAGGEEYKYSFGVKERFSRRIEIGRLSLLMRLKRRIPLKVKRLGKALLLKK